MTFNRMHGKCRRVLCGWVFSKDLQTGTVLNLIQSLLPRDKIRLTVAMKLGSRLQKSIVDPDLNFGNIYG